MGLDMYLEASKYISDGAFSDGKPDRAVKVLEEANIPLDHLDDDRLYVGIEVVFTAAYWRKANAIHAWFVRNCQDGTDNCRRSYVSRQQLARLRKDCADAHQALIDGDTTVAEELLPTTPGFFFGSYEYDEWYEESLKYTIKAIDKILSPDFDGYTFYYTASW